MKMATIRARFVPTTRDFDERSINQFSNSNTSEASILYIYGPTPQPNQTHASKRDNC